MKKHKRGKIGWIPAGVLFEINDIKREDDLSSDAEAMRKMMKYSRVGREVKRLKRGNISQSELFGRRPPVDSFSFNPPEKKKKKKGMLGL